MKSKQNFCTKITSCLLVLTLSTSYNITSYAGITLPLGGEAAKEKNQPFQHSYRAIDMENWTPETDPYSELLRSKVPLQKRIEPFKATQANPNLESEALLTNLNGDYGNSFFESTPYNNEFSQYLYNFWQYTDYYGSWHGVATQGVPISLYIKGNGEYKEDFEFGILNLPNPAYTNAAHKNGVSSLGCVFIPRTGQPYKSLLKQDKDGKYIIAEKLIEMKEYFGFDGYFINQETSVDPKDIIPYKEFTKALVDAGVYVQWYDCIDDVKGELKYKPQLLDSHSSFVIDPQLGRVNNSIFMNYNWNSPDGWNNGDSEDKQYINATVEEAEKRGINPLTDVLMGIENSLGKFDGSHNSTRNADLILDDSKNPVAGIAMFTPDYVQRALDEDLGDSTQNRRADDSYQWMIAERERMLFTSVGINPLDTDKKPGYSREDVGIKDASQWTGISRYISERSVLNNPNFITNFNTGHGLSYWIDGKISNESEWSNINIQDILPTWQWWIDTKENNGTKLQVDFDYGSKYVKGEKFNYTQIGAYKGGSSLVINGVLDNENFLHLYKSDIPVEENSKISITFNKVSGKDTSEMKLGLIFKDNPDKIEYISIPKSQYSKGLWNTEEIDLNKYNGKSIATIGLLFDTNSQIDPDYQINIGEIKLTTGNNKPKKPESLAIMKVFDTNEMYLKWELDNYDDIKQYNIYCELSNGKEKFLGGIYDNIFYIKNLDKDVSKLKLTAVGADGSESEADIINFSFTNKINNLNILQDEKTFDVIWEETDKEFKNIILNLKIEGQNTIKKILPKGENKTRFNINTKEGLNYELSVIIDNDVPITYTGKLKDTYSQPYNEGILVNGDKIELFTPASKDWYNMYVKIDGVTSIRKRAKDSLNNFVKPNQAGTIEIILEDYKGNKSEPTIYNYNK